MNERLRKAAAELTALTTEREEKPKQADNKTLLAKAAQDLIGVGNRILGIAKSDDGHDYEEQDEEAAAQNKGKKKRNPINESGEETLAEQLAENKGESFEEAEDGKEGSVLVSGKGKRPPNDTSTPGKDGYSEAFAAQRKSEIKGNLFKGMAEDETFAEVVEASPALALLTDTFADAFSDLAVQNEQLLSLCKSQAAQLDDVLAVLGPLAKSQALIIKSGLGAAQPGKTTPAGIIGRTDGNGPTSIHKAGGAPGADEQLGGDRNAAGNRGEQTAIRKSDAIMSIQKAIRAGEATPKELELLDAGGFNALTLSNDIRTKYGLPLMQGN